MKPGEIVSEFLEKNGWKYNQDDDCFFAFVEGDNCTIQLQWLTDDGTQEFFIRGQILNKIPKPSRSYVGEFLHRANGILPRGSFDMDYDEGIVGFRMFIDARDITLPTASLERATWWIIDIMNRYYLGMMDVCHGSVTPKEAIEKIENERIEASSESSSPVVEA